MATATVEITLFGKLKCKQGREASENGHTQQAIQHYTEALEAFNKTDDVPRQTEVIKLIRRENVYARREQTIQEYTEALHRFTKINDVDAQKQVNESIRREQEMILGDKKSCRGCDKFETHIYVAKRAFEDAIKHYKNGHDQYAEAEANRNTAECLRRACMVNSEAKFDKEADRLFTLIGRLDLVKSTNGDLEK
tara:strand:+ start:442 stop:1023 length:582 start_codon:yes stop_codon:yes gene_type:complete